MGDMKKIRFSFLVSSFLLMLCAASAETLVGELSGEFVVNNLGAAGYTVPLAISPGTAGVEPKLTVGYSSRGGNGLLGLGFSLGGLSMITRGGASLDQDGFIDGVDFDDNDRFLLDGQRLEVVVPGTSTNYYGTAESEYRTEIDSFSRVVAHGQAGNGPAWFEVWTKSGLIYEYGNTTDSSFKPGIYSSVMSWAVNKVSDTVGNYMTFTYEATSAGPQISRIDYTGNTNAPVLALYNSVEFSYEERPDPTLHFFKGAQMEQTNRLSKITMEQGTTYMHEYRFGYTTNEAGQSILESFQQYFGEGAGADCLPTNRFEFSGCTIVSNFNYTSDSSLHSIDLDANHPVWTGDFNGDGLTDIFALGYAQYNHWVGLSNGDGTFDFRENSDFLPNVTFDRTAHTVLTGDFNGDGLTDICQVSAYNGQSNYRWLAISDGDGSFTLSYGSDFLSGVSAYKSGGFLAQDFNGDGVTDLLGLGGTESQNWIRYSNEGGGTTTTNGNVVLPTNYGFYNANDTLTSGDFNGDGLTDILAVGPDSSHRWVGLSDGDGSFTYVADTNLLSFSVNPKQYQPVRTGDFNGDGLTDFFSLGYGFADRWIGLSNGDGTFDFKENNDFLDVADYAYTFHKILTGDFNGDGLTDICQVGGSSSDRWIALSKGDGSFELTTGTEFLSAGSVDSNLSTVFAQDYNGDGFTDLVGFGRPFSLSGHDNYRWIALSNGDGGFTSTVGYDVLPQNLGFSGAYDNLISGDFDGNGMPDVMCMSYTSQRWVGLNGREMSRVEKITQGYQSETEHGVVTEIEYLPLSDTNIYVKGSGAEFPIRDIISPTYVVSTLTKDNGLEGTYRTDYSYRAARYHVHGRGFLGFQQFESYDLQTKLSYVETLAHDFPFTGRALKTETFYIPDPSGDPEDSGYRQLIKLVENDWIFDLVNGGTLFAYNPKSTETKWELGQTNAPISDVATWNWFDIQDTAELPPTVQPTNLYAEITHGNLSQNVIDYGGGLKQTTQNGYDDWVDSMHWLLGRLDASSVTHESTGQDDVVRSSSFDYDAVTGLLSQETIEPGDSEYELLTDYYYDAFGNITNKTITPAGFPPRSILENEYDAKGRFVEASRNALGHETTFVNDQLIGKPLSSTGPNGLTTHWLYDETGRAIHEELPDGTVTTNTYIWDYATTVSVPFGTGSTSNVVQKAIYKLHAETDGAPPVTTWFDKQGREIRVQTLSADGRTVNKDTGYNAIALPIAVSEPYFATSGTPVYTFTEYDGLGRPQYVTAPDGTVSEQVYDGLSSQAIIDSNHRTSGSGTPKHQITTTVKNTKGEVLSVTDATMVNTVIYTYDPVGNLTQTTDPENHKVEMEYDLRGNKVWQKDPDMGEWNYTYNALDQLTSQTDANGNHIETDYDLLGRTAARTNWIMNATGLEIEATAKWIYDGTSEGTKLGTLRREEHRDAQGRFINRKTYAYDEYSRPMLELRNYDSKWFYTTLEYDAYSRIRVADRFWRPAGMEGVEHQLSPVWNSFGTTNTYNTYGALLEVRDGSNTVWWECNAGDYDEYGRLVQFQYGNGLTTTNHFNPLTGRMDGAGILNGAFGMAEYGFQYDRVGNLTQRSLERGMQTLTEDGTYDSLNRLLSSSIGGATNYLVSATYDALGNIGSRSDIGTYLYNGPRPHAVTKAGDCDYYYDNNGNIVRRDRNSQYEFTAQWNSFNKSTHIFEGTEGSEFEYDVNGRRTQQLIFEGTNVTKKIYIAETYEMKERLVNPAEPDRALWQWEPVHSRIYVDTPAGRVGIYEQAALTNGTGAVTRSWLHKDHLSSVVAVSDASANITHYSYDAWGNRRDPSDWSPATINNQPTTSLSTDRGYTGHEQLDHLQLVHMNGRIYDPVIGRMISPDPIIQSPENLQSFNRYSYVMNRPLSLTDPSGFVSSGLEMVLGASFGSSGGSGLMQAVDSKSLSTKDRIEAIKSGVDIDSLIESQIWSSLNESSGSYETQSTTVMTENTIYWQNYGSLLPDPPVRRRFGGGGYGLGTGGGRRPIGADLPKPETGLNANDIELGKGDHTGPLVEGPDDPKKNPGLAAIADGINNLHESKWGQTDEGKAVVAALVYLYKNKRIRAVVIDGLGETWGGKYIGGSTDRLYFSVPNPLIEQRAGALEAMLAHEGTHKVDEMRGEGSQDGYGFDDEREAYDNQYEVDKEFLAPVPGVIAHRATDPEIWDAYKEKFDDKTKPPGVE